MHQVNLNDDLYQEVRRRADAAGFPSVDDYVADVLAHDCRLDDENLDHLFSPERLALIDGAAAEMDAGQGLTLEQADAVLAKRKEEWLRRNHD